MADDLTQEGTIAGWLQSEVEGWARDNKRHAFAPIEYSGIRLEIVKRTDRQLAVTVTGPFGRSFDFLARCPKPNEQGVHVAVTWGNSTVTLYVAGKRVADQKAKLH